MKNRRNIVEQKYPPENPNDIWLKDGKFYRSTSEGWVVVDSETEYTSKESMIADNPKGGTIGIDKETGEASIYNDVAKQWSPLGGGGGGMTKTTWQELKDKRDNGQLISGSLYRITDYNCTTTQENTQSAGHQFDIVLLALSKDKLAEEGWAMEHSTDIYTAICTDGVEFKIAFYSYIDSGSEVVDMVDINSLKAKKVGAPLSVLLLEFEMLGLLDKNTKTIHIPQDSTEYIEGFTKENAIYNYFQNSNLSAWKVWYCLDNDTARFAWADDNTTQSIILNNSGSDVEFERCPEEDVSEPSSIRPSDYFTFYAWCSEIEGENYTSYTIEECPTMYSTIHMKNSEGRLEPVESVRITGIKGFGRGVVYRLIDEWNNDCPYDFKNIIIILDGRREKGYLFSPTDANVFSDMSLTGIFNDITVKKTIADNYCQVIDMGILVALRAECCNIIVASGALSRDRINSLPSNAIFGYRVSS